MKQLRVNLILPLLFIFLIPSFIIAQQGVTRWTQATAAAGWSTRHDYTSVVFDNKMWVIGGGSNDVWYSSDGIDWFCATPNAAWSVRESHTSVVFDNKIWVMGGNYYGSLQNDVWYSTDGVNWTQATANAEWSARYGHASVILNNKMWIIGGFDGIYKNDVWYSSNGVNWTQATANAGWSARFGFASVVFDNKMWVIGGQSPSSGQKNDVWYSSDGITWTQVTANAGWSARYHHTSVVFDNKMWVIGGDIGPGLKNDVWYSSNGVNWTLSTANAEWSARLYHTSVMFDNKIWVIGGWDGMYENDVWYSCWDVCSLISPNGGELWSGGSNHIIKWRADTSGFTCYRILLSRNSGSSWTDTIVHNVSPCETTYNWIVPSLNLTTCQVSVQILDTNGSVIAFDVSDSSFMIDTDQPSAFNLILPANGAWGNGTPDFIWQHAIDNFGMSHYQIFIDGNLRKDSISDTTYILVAPKLSEGWHSWFVRAVDRAGNWRQSTQTYSIRVDTTPPINFNLISPVDSLWTTGIELTYSWQASSDNGCGLSKYQLWLDGILNRDNISPTTTSTTHQGLLGTGIHTWYIRAIDSVGNIRISNQSRFIRVDTTPPSTFNLIYPINNSWTQQHRPRFTWHSTVDIGIGLRIYHLYIDSVLRDSVLSPDTTIISPIALNDGLHSWYVKAIDGLNNYVNSSTWNINIDSTPPTAFNLVCPYDSSITSIPTPNLIWRRSGDIGIGFCKYELWIDSIRRIDSLGLNDTIASVLLTEGYHIWFVKAFDNLYNVKNSNQNWTILFDWTPPDTFSLSSPVDNDTTRIQSPRLYWHPAYDAGSGIKKYQLWVNGVVNRDSISATDTFTTPISPLPNYSNNTWFIKAFDRANGTRSSNQTWRFIVVRDSLAPSTPNLIAPINGSYTRDSMPKFWWHKATDTYKILFGVQSYELQYARNSGFTNATLVNVTDTSYQVPTRLNDTTYYWRVRAVDSAGNQSAWSSVWSFEIDTRIPNAPTLVSPINGVWFTNTNIIFNWSQVTFYKIIKPQITQISTDYYKEDEDNKGVFARNEVTDAKHRWSDKRHQQSLKIATGLHLQPRNDITSSERFASPVRYLLQVDTSRNFSNPITDTTSLLYDTLALSQRRYFWRVRAYDLAGNQGAFSGRDSFGIDYTAPSVPSLISPANGAILNNYDVTFIWHRSSDNLSGVSSYTMQGALDPFFIFSYDSTVTDTTFTITIPYDTTFYWRVKSHDRAGNESNWSSARYFTIHTSGIEEIENLQIPLTFSLYNKPNPFSRMTEIRYGIPYKCKVNIIIFNAAGEQIATLLDNTCKPGWRSLKWDGKNYKGKICPNGIYFYRLKTEDYQMTRKMLLLK